MTSQTRDAKADHDGYRCTWLHFYLLPVWHFSPALLILIQLFNPQDTIQQNLCLQHVKNNVKCSCILKVHRLVCNSVDPDEVPHNELPHLALHIWQTP